jgi:hypothetical protein
MKEMEYNSRAYTYGTRATALKLVSATTPLSAVTPNLDYPKPNVVSKFQYPFLYLTNCSC